MARFENAGEESFVHGGNGEDVHVKGACVGEGDLGAGCSLEAGGTRHGVQSADDFCLGVGCSLDTGGTMHGVQSADDCYLGVGTTHCVRSAGSNDCNSTKGGRDLVDGTSDADNLISDIIGVPGRVFWQEAASGSIDIPDFSVGGGSDVKHSLSRFPQCSVLSKSRVALARPRASAALRGAYPEFASIYTAVCESQMPNYRGRRLRVPSKLNIDEWRRSEHLLSDSTLVDMLAFGFPAGYESDVKPKEGCQNHGSALRHQSDIVQFIHKEVELGAMLGPFKQTPFVDWDRRNPMMTCPKRDSTRRRVILDLSYPHGQSVNSGVPSGWLDGAEFKMRLPNPWDLAEAIRQQGRGALIYKVDLSRAYRQLRSCPLDWPLLSVAWEEELLVDVAVPFGLRHGASACQRTTEAVAELVRQEVDARVFPYVDDSAGVADPLVAMMHYQALLDCMSRLGLDAAVDKCTPPTTRLCWIGVIFDSVAMTMEIEPGRIEEALEWCDRILGAHTISKHYFQKFMGKLNYAARCTKGALYESVIGFHEHIACNRPSKAYSRGEVRY